MTSTVVFDLDDVLADADNPAKQHFGPCDETIYRWVDRWPDQVDEVTKFINDPAVYAAFPPIPGAREFVRQLWDKGTEIYVVTARPVTGEMDVVTRGWLRMHGFINLLADVILTDAGAKPKVVKSLAPMVVYEDAPNQVEQMRGLGLPVVIFAQPWNRRLDGLRRHGWGPKSWMTF